MKILHGVPVFLMHRYLLCFYLSLQNLSDSGMILPLPLHCKMQFSYLHTYLLTYTMEQSPS